MAPDLAGRPDDGPLEPFDRGGAWTEPPVPWSDGVDDRIVAEVLAQRVQQLLVTPPDQQRQVILLRDVEGMQPTDVSALLGITNGNQRVLLHRCRARLRALLSVEMVRNR